MHSEIRRRPEGALLRTYLRAAGMARDSMSKPLIGVVTSATQVFSEKPDAKDLGSAVVSGIEASGGIAVRWDTVRTPDQMTWGHAESYSFAWRDQLADFVESWARQEALDGLVLVGDSHKTLAGMTMAAARLNLPAIIVTGGPHRWEYRQPAENSNKKIAPAQDPYELLTETLFGKKKPNESTIELFNECLLTQDDHASYALDLVLEALGVSLPGMATAPAQSARRHELAYASGQRVLGLLQSGHTFRRFLSQNSFTNAIRVNAALGGAIDVAVHLMALAHETGVTLPLDYFDKIARETPQLCRLGGVGEKEPHRIEDLDRAGGVWAILHAFKSQVAPTTTINGRGALDLAKTTDIKDPHVIQASHPYFKQSGIGVLRGNLAPKGAMFLLNQVWPALSKFSGPAVVFENEVEAAKETGAGKVKKGSALIVKGQGPKGGPGLRKLRLLPALMASRGLNKVLPLLTDGRLPDNPAGLFISLVTPESAVMGALAVVKNGDHVEIDVQTRQLRVRLTETDLRIRLSRWQSPVDSKGKRGFLERYSRSVSEMNEGAVLK